jgi:sulfur-carrier protein
VTNVTQNGIIVKEASSPTTACEIVASTLQRMPRVAFTTTLKRHVECPAAEVEGTTAHDVLDAYFTQHPKVRSYVLDETGAVRKHVVVFVGGRQLVDVLTLSDTVEHNAEVYVMQALSGG